MSRRPIQRGDLVRKTVDKIDFYGVARTAESIRANERIRVAWHPEFGTWESPAELTVISVLSMGAA